MRSVRTLAAVLAALVADVTFAQGNKPTQEVLVTNTTLPVTVGNTPSVNVANTTPVPVAVQGNVTVAGGVTTILYTAADPGGTLVPANPGGMVTWLDVAPYAKLRLAAGNICTSVGSVTVDIRQADGPGFIIDEYQLAPCSSRDKIYELPGVRVSVAVWNTSATETPNRVFVQVWGR